MTFTKENSLNYNKISNSGILTIGESDSEYYISSGNLIENIDIDPLINKLDLIKKMDKDELKKLHLYLSFLKLPKAKCIQTSFQKAKLLKEK